MKLSIAYLNACDHHTMYKNTVQISKLLHKDTIAILIMTLLITTLLMMTILTILNMGDITYKWLYL